MHEVIKAQQELMREYNLDGLVAMTPENFGYVSGVMVPTQVTVRSRHAIHILNAQGQSKTVVVNIEEGLVKSSSWLDSAHISSYNEFTQDPIVIAGQKMLDLGLDGKRVGIEMNYLPYKDYLKLVKAVPSIELVDAQELFEKLRKVKLFFEIERIEAFGSQAEDVIYSAFSGVHAGMTENDIKNIIVKGFSAIGGDKLTVLTVASGERSCFLNAPATDRVLKSGDVVRIDLVGVDKKGYYCDVCRSAVVGEPTDEHNLIWSRLVQSHDEIVSKIRPGADTKDIYDDFLRQFEEWNYPAVDFVGHGLGLSLHEEPYIGRYARNILQAGMAMCVEPIMIKPDCFGFQLENEVLVTESGCKVISANKPYDKLFKIADR
ncbi:Xaa-Pro peptidase family protein [Lutispora sp.]|uniref:Xaa-Pro peptidase family protein n=1 Tax=Lutispora sp. TaxID=2828727 RepID=UPI002B214867|nr:Xaa-Pro peptidase family protein [Lutispora sp.]MEA4962990.1 Xaa-Pro peptidase family protein [Lutispora sp.]